MAGKSILLAAGGTGGHLFPAEALAHALIARGWTVHLATDDRAARYASGFPGEVHQIASATIGSRNPIALARTFAALWRGFRQSSKLLARLKPSVVVGFGGYPTLPPLFAATRRGIPTIIHEQNAVMGRANKALASRVTAIAGGFLDESGPFGAKTVTTGNPLRPAVIDAAAVAYEPPARNGRFQLLVFGGSQGAQFFSEAMPAAVAALPDALRSRLDIVQQARAEDEAIARDGYKAAGVDAEIAPFFTDLAQRMAKAHLVVSRSGASTVSEIAAIGRPALLVPYPYALDHDQAANAAALAAAGGAEVHPQSTMTRHKIAELLAALMSDPSRLGAMAKAARAAGKPDAAMLLADLTEVIASGRSADDFRKGARP